jgi:hypothetical protein
MANIPISGELVSKHGWLSIAMFSGSTLLLGAALLILARLSLNPRIFAIV